MKKTGIALILTILFMLIFITACGGDKDGTAGYSYVYVSDVLKSLEKSVDSIIKTEKGTEETDGNNLLGKANQYIEFGWFMDERAVPEWDDNPEFNTDNGGTLEKFANEKDAKARHEYLQTFTGAFAQFSEVHGVWVIRLSNNFSASRQNELIKIIKTAITDLN